MSARITIIGAGNLGCSIAEGLIESKLIPANQLTVTKRNINSIQYLQDKGVRVLSDNIDAVKTADWILLAVKPFQAAQVLAEIKPHLQEGKQKIISVLTGISLADLEAMLSPQFTIVRAMPNTAIALRESMTCIAVNSTTQQEDKDFITTLFRQLGEAILIDENLMDAATVLGACGTAFAMRFIRANIQGGIEIGFSATIASLIASQTIKGAAAMLLKNNTHPEQEIDKVTTPKGCTIAGLNEMEHQGFSSSLIKGIKTSYHKIKNDM